MMEYLVLKDVCRIKMGQSPESSSYNESGDGIPFFQGNADFGERYPVTRIWCTEPTKIANAGDILISVRAPIGALNYAREVCCIGRGLAAITPDSSKFSTEFIFWLLKGKNAELNSKGTGSTFKAIGRKVLEDTMIPDYGFEQQHACAVNLEKVYAVIQMRRQELLKLDELIKARFIEMFGTLEWPANDFPRDILKNLCYKITDGKHGGCTQEDGTGRFFVGAREIYDDAVHYDTAPQINVEEFEKDYKRCNVEKGDFLIVNTGATIGKSAIAIDDKTEYTLLQKSVALLKVKYSVLHPVFLKYCYIVNDKMYRVESASAQPNLLLSKIKATEIYVPPMQLQEQFVAFVAQVDKSKIEVQKSLDEAQLLFDSLMQQYFG